MIENADIAPGAITEPKLSKNFRLNLTNVEKGADGQIPVVQSDGSMAYKSVGGDATLDSSGNFTVTTSTSSTGETTQGATGATGPAGATGATGAQGATGAVGSDANVTAENVDGALGFTGSTAGLVKRTADNTFALDTATYSTTDHDHTLADISDSGGAAALDVWAGVGPPAGTVCAGDDGRLSDTRNPNSHKASHSTGGTDVLSPSDIGASADDHTHDDRYYTETESDTLLATKSGTGHNHDDRYYTETEADTLLATKSGTGHTHDDRYYTETEADALLATKSATTHTHDERYYTETETDTLLATKAGTGHTHDDRYYTETEADTLLATKAASSHTHDDRYYTETESDTLLATKAATSHTHDDRYYTETEADTLLATKAASTHNHSGADITSGTIDTDRLDVGASSGKVAAGDHAHASYITGNQSITLSGDVTGSGTTAITCVVGNDSHTHSTSTLTGLGGAAEKDVGTGSGDVAQGNHTHAAGTTSAAGFISTTDKTKLDACMEVDDDSSLSTKTWSAAKIGSNALAVMALPQLHPVKVFKIEIDWGNSTQPGCTYPVGTDPDYNGIIDIEHNLNTSYIICSITDPDGVVKPTKTQFDMNFEDEVLVKVVDADNIRITFAHLDDLSEGDAYQLSIIGIT